MRSRNLTKKNVEQIKPTAESQHDTDEFELARILDETLSLIEKSDHISVYKLDSFRFFEKSLKQKDERSMFTKFIKRLFSYWDVILLLFLNILFATYLCYFFSVYNSPNPRIDIANKVTQIKHWLITQWLYYDGFTDLTKGKCKCPMYVCNRLAVGNKIF
jgi:hypothetical protein